MIIVSSQNIGIIRGQPDDKSTQGQSCWPQDSALSKREKHSIQLDHTSLTLILQHVSLFQELYIGTLTHSLIHRFMV